MDFSGFSNQFSIPENSKFIDDIVFLGSEIQKSYCLFIKRNISIENFMKDQKVGAGKTNYILEMIQKEWTYMKKY